MSNHDDFTPQPAGGATIEKDGESWTLVLVRELRHSPQKVWKALTEPEQLKHWSPFDANQSLATAGASVLLTIVGTPYVSETLILRAEAPRVLQFNWGDREVRWELEATANGTRLTLWNNIDRNYIAMGAAGWHLCFEVLERHLAENPLGRIVGSDALHFTGWQRLHGEYLALFKTEF